MQNKLFANQDDPTCFEEHDLGDAWIREYPHGFGQAQSDALLQRLLQEIPWRQDSLWIAGKEIPVPRLQCWMGDRGSDYGYSGMRLEPIAWSESVLTIRRRVQALTGHEFNSVLLNYYRNGQDSVAWHADDEPELGPLPLIASVSLGTTRAFQLRHKYDKSSARRVFDLQHGSVLLLDGRPQRSWQHQVPKQPGIQQPRVNLTFRSIRPSRAAD